MSMGPDRLLDNPFAKVGQVLALSVVVGIGIGVVESHRASQQEANLIALSDPDGKIRAYQGLMINLRGNPRFAKSHILEHPRQDGRGIIRTEDGTKYFALPSPVYESTGRLPKNQVSEHISWDHEITVMEHDSRRVYGIQTFYLFVGDPKSALARLRIIEETREDSSGKLSTIRHIERLS